ncbi:MAG: N-acetylglucosamine-6-phosphate deacetylase [Dehalococcoidia bacterium]
MAGQLLIRGATVQLAAGPARMEILCEGARIVAVGRGIEAPSATVVEAEGLQAGPGFIDVHVHGGGGHSFFGSNAEAVRAYAAWAPRNGVTSFLVSTIGRDASETTAVFAGLAPAIGCGGGAEPLGFHLEGPFINPLRMGAFHPRMLRPPDPAEFERHQRAAGGAIRQVTLAPELPGALELVGAVTGSGAIAAMGHTDGMADEAAAGFAAGITHVTHLFNAMRPIHQREGGPAVAALIEDAATCELICDGAHVAPELLRMAYRVLGPQRMVVVTDNLHIAGTAVSSGTFGGQAVEVSGAKAMRADGTIVGSVATMDQHFRNAVSFLGIDPAGAFRLCAANPARVAGAGQRKGALVPGFDADIVLLDAALRVQVTVCRGEVAFDAREPGA